MYPVRRGLLTSQSTWCAISVDTGHVYVNYTTAAAWYLTDETILYTYGT